MRKTTLLLLLLISVTAFSQTILYNYDGVDPAFEFCFDTPDPNECTSTRETNNDTSGDNPSNTYWQSIAPTIGGAFGYGLGAEFNLTTLPTINANGSFLTIAFRSDNNPTGTLNISAQLWANDNDKIDAFSAYTKTDGTWQIVEFDFTGSSPQGSFTLDTEILRTNFFINEGEANQYVYGIDEVTLNTTTLSTNEFKTGAARVWPNPVLDELNVNGRISGDYIRVFDMLGKEILKQVIHGEDNTLNVSNLARGIYFLKLDNGSTFKFMKR